MGRSVASRFDRELLRRLREGRGWTLRDLSKRTGVSNPFLSQLETGRAAPSFDSAIAIAEAFGLALTTFVRPRAPEGESR